MPVRKITTSRRSFISHSFSKKNNKPVTSESTLEKDYVATLEFDHNVISYEDQPLTIHYETAGRQARYTPDFLVTERIWDDEKNDYIENIILVEVKYRADLRENWALLKPKFKAAKNYCHLHGWSFKIFTELEIRNAYLDNVRFLQKFRSSSINKDYLDVLTTLIGELRITTPEELILVASNDNMRRAEFLHVLWFMVAKLYVMCDLSKELSMNTPIWITDETN